MLGQGYSIHEQHLHIHGPDCGHSAVEHVGHLDYLDDGHLHHAHDGHYDDKVGQHPYGIAQRLGQDDIDQAAGAAATPSARLVLVLAAVHAARTGAIRAAQLDDVDLGNRRLIIAGRVRPIDEFTHQILLDWLGYRRTRWPDTANPHLLINQHSAMGTGPVSTIYFAQTKLRGQAATLERLRVDRQLEEALAHGPDPLHLAAVFGLDPKTAIRYAENARLLLTTRDEEQGQQGVGVRRRRATRALPVPGHSPCTARALRVGGRRLSKGQTLWRPSSHRHVRRGP